MNEKACLCILVGFFVYIYFKINIMDSEKFSFAESLREKREQDYEKEKSEIVGMFDGLKKASESAERRATRLEAMKLAVQAGYDDLGMMSAVAENIYQFIVKPE